MTTTRYTITDAAALAAIGAPKYWLGTWDHYTTTADGMARFCRAGKVTAKSVAGKFLNLSDSDFQAALKHGLMVPA